MSLGLLRSDKGDTDTGYVASSDLATADGTGSSSREVRLKNSNFQGESCLRIAKKPPDK